MRFTADRRFIEIMFGMGLLLAGLSSGDTGATIVLFILGLYLLGRQFNRTETRGKNTTRRAPSRRVEFEEEEDLEFVPTEPRTDQVYAHALDAVKRAGLDPTQITVLPIDVGVMAFSGDQEPVIYRTRPVLDDIDYVQPYVQLRLPTRARGRVRFEIADSDGQVLFIHEEDHNFDKGRNLVVPAARLRIHEGHAMHGDWGLRVMADGVLIADHHFGWQESTTKTIRRHLTEDGELSGEIRAMMAEDTKLERMSLDELLEAQEPDDKQQARR
jgi:hypothetical protein